MLSAADAQGSSISEDDDLMVILRMVPLFVANFEQVKLMCS